MISRWGGGGADPLGGHQPLTCTLLGQNVCENERNGSCWGRHVPAAPPGSANETGKQDNRNFQIFPSTCCPSLQTKHFKGQALLLSNLIGQGGSCMDKM